MRCEYVIEEDSQELCGETFDTKQKLAAHQFRAHEFKAELKEIDHGSVNGYMMHRRREESACAACRKAWNESIREKRSRK